MDEAREVAVTSYLEKFCWDDWIERDECGIDFRAGWDAAMALAQEMQAASALNVTSLSGVPNGEPWVAPKP